MTSQVLPFSLSLLVPIFSFCGLSILSAAPVITSISCGPVDLELLVEDDGTSNNFDVEASLSLEDGTWGMINNATITPLGDHRYRITLAKSQADREFFRVIGGFLSSTLDRDGDGIDNDREINDFGTDPDRFDTDGDGFSDATEIALGTSPTDNTNFPELASLPAVDFQDSISTVEEGIGSHTITLNASPSYTGLISLSVNSRSSAQMGVDYTGVPSSVMMNGGTATFTVNIIDDLEIRPSRQLILDLTSNPASDAYRAAGSVTHIVNINDNDAYWFGTLKGELAERSFRICLVRNATTVQANFVSGQSDGLPDTDDGASSLSTGVIPDKDLAGNPQEIWPANSINFDLGTPTFSVTVTGLPTMPNAILDESLVRSLSLVSTPTTEEAHQVRRDLILGSYIEQITHATDPETIYLNRTLTGTFALVRDVAPAPVINSPFNPTVNNNN